MAIFAGIAFRRVWRLPPVTRHRWTIKTMAAKHGRGTTGKLHRRARPPTVPATSHERGPTTEPHPGAHHQKPPPPQGLATPRHEAPPRNAGTHHEHALWCPPHDSPRPPTTVGGQSAPGPAGSLRRPVGLTSFKTAPRGSTARQTGKPLPQQNLRHPRTSSWRARPPQKTVVVEGRRPSSRSWPTLIF